jgi:hypothetical protein
MKTSAELYAVVRPDLVLLVSPLSERSEKMLRDHGDFLPHAAVLTSDRKVSLVGAMCNKRDGFANSWHILPMLHDGLRAMANEKDIVAVAVAERVGEIPGISREPAIKIQVEHQRAFSIAFYLPFARDSSGEFAFGNTLTILAEPEIKVWTQGF